MTTILETLLGAKINLIDNSKSPLAGMIGRDQLKNAVALLEKGYGLEHDTDALIEQHGEVENVPEHEKPQQGDINTFNTYSFYEHRDSLKNTNKNIEEVFNELRLERERQNAKWGEQNHAPVEWIAIISEELGEASREAVDSHFGNPVKLEDGSYSPVTHDVALTRLVNYRNELIQLAAVTIQAIECQDRAK